MMTFYFGKIDTVIYHDIDLDEVFYHNDNYYWYKVVSGEEDFMIYDTCNRVMPIPVDCGSGLATVLFAINTVETARIQAEVAVAKKMTEMAAVVEFYSE